MEAENRNPCVVVDVKKSLANIASEICVNYCKLPDEYAGIEFEDEATALLSEEHCQMCPLVQFLT